MFTKALAGAACAAYASAQADLEFTKNNYFKLKNAAFLSVDSFEGSEDFLLVSSFGAMSSGHIYMVPGVKDAVVAGDVGELSPVQLDTPKFEWPNNTQVIPQDVFGERAIVVPDGFLVPGKSNGGVYIVRMDATNLTQTVDTVKITEKKKGFF